MDKNKKHNKQMADKLNECFESALIKNESVDSCLARHAQDSEELKPLLETMKAARAAASISPDPSFRARARYEFRSALYDNSARKMRPGLAWRWATVASTIGVFLLTSAGGAVAASSNSMPGQTLYQLKRSIEDVQLTLTPSQADKARFYVALADRRVSEIVYAAQSGDVKTTEDLTRQFTADLGMVSAIAEPGRLTTFGDGSKQSGATVTENMTPDQTTAIATNNATAVPNGTATPSASATSTTMAPGVTVSVSSVPNTAVSSSAVTLPPESVSNPPPTVTQPQVATDLDGITDPSLLKLLQQYSVKNVAELMSVLDRVPSSTRAALLAAIQAATSAYGQILG